MCRRKTKQKALSWFMTSILIGLIISTANAADLAITESSLSRGVLDVKGSGQNGSEVVITDTDTTTVLGTENVSRKGTWSIRNRSPDSSPCRVTATSGGISVVQDVQNAADSCSTVPEEAVTEEPVTEVPNPPVEPPLSPISGNFTILAANDLGMHCADQDYRIFSILPPYNVLNAQVLRKGSEPQLMSPADGVQVSYRSAVANIIDPNEADFLKSVLEIDSVNSTSENSEDVYKQNFWQQSLDLNPTDPLRDTLALGWLAYDALYPVGVIRMFPDIINWGLPAPDLVQLYFGPDGIPGTGDESLAAHQSEMPLDGSQPFHGYVEDLPFFVKFPFGYRVNNFNRYTAEGIPITTVDDMGRNNAYPLMLVEAKDADGNVLAAVNTVVPVASEADCAICHASQDVCNVNPNLLVCNDVANSNYPDTVRYPDRSVSFIESSAEALAIIGANNEQKVINSAKTNILRLHDYKHNTSLAGSEADGSNGMTTPNVVCANCHYSPALDLAHLGPTDENGKEQTQHISMSRAMHGVHGNLSTSTDYDNYGDLFPIMPPPSDGMGNLRDPEVAEGILMETCYNCHPGKQNKCLRGAMGGSGTVCQDCHGQLTQVGDDFTEDFPTDGFPGGADLTKRVSWASEPQCQACHVGDVNQVVQLQNDGQLDDTLINMEDSHGNPDGLRLQMTYKLSDHKSISGPDSSNNLALLDFPDSRFATTESLYRLSGADNKDSGKGHGDLSCEGCHGSTHAIWPNKNPYSNDNKASTDLQGHVGTIIECKACHTGEMDSNLGGPHGLHPVGNTKFVENHGGLAESDPPACYACHGADGEGSVLARAATERTGLKTDFDGQDGLTKDYSKGEVITCTDCHTTALQ